jgi:flagellar basal-body rod modification protein FlgD
MATTNPLASLAGATSAPSTTASAAASASGKLADTYDSFLKLLTTQLQHQDPLSPMDSNQFVSQLVAFAGVEQQIAQNANLEKLIKLQQGGITAGSLGYIGKSVQATSDVNQLTGGQAEFGYALPSNAATVTLAVVDQLGRVVYATAGQTSAGAHTFTWNGKDAAGNTLPDGEYRLRVGATDTTGNAVTPSISAIGTVTGVEQGANGPLLSLHGTRVPLDSVTAILEPTH